VSDHDQDPESHEEVLPNAAADEFFGRMKRDFRRPKPSEEAIASALQAIQKLTGEFPVEHSFRSSAQASQEKCPKCGGENSASNRFCGYCGTLMQRPEEHVDPAAKDRDSSGQHVYHHHYHHHIFSDSPAKEQAESLRWNSQASPVDAKQAVVPPKEQAESTDAVQKLIQKWSRSFNARRLDELMELYSSDSIVLRPNSAPAHGKDAVRKVLESGIESGVGDVQLECAEIGIVGDFACLTGQSKMLFPTAPAKRQEATGKYLIVVRRESGEWKIVADSWCMDAPKAPMTPTGTPAAPSRGQRKTT
jgi:uncharacterized protein (TIGR02246 family)